MRTIIIASALILAGCAPQLSFANEAGGVINKTGSLGNDRAYAMANAHCKKYGTVPRISDRNILTNTLNFDCVKP